MPTQLLLGKQLFFIALILHWTFYE